ncbi:MAG: hypothetical protein HQ513_03440, partial [Rhodospirillales bacterium]|nr:hypothetical protein [Rhodospirillales bacterium]
VNRKKFEALPADVQKGILKASEIAEQKFGAVYDAAFDQVKSEQLAAGYTVTELSAADVVAWENASKLSSLQAEWVAASKSAGLANAAEVMAQVKAILNGMM